MYNSLIVSVDSIGYLTRMLTRGVALQVTVILGIALCLMAACDQVTLPRITTAPPPQPKILASVTLIFDDSVRTATLEQTVCSDVQWKGQLGDAVIDAFLETGRARFAQVTVGETAATPQPASSPQSSAVTATIKLYQASFKPRTRTGDADNFLAQFDVQLGALFQDASGRTFPEAQLVYSDQVKIFTDQFGGGDQCATGQLDGALKTAAKHLAAQLPGYVAEVTGKGQGQTTAGAQIPAANPRFGEPSMLSVKATLLDENNNLVFEAGEKVGVRLDVTNTGTTPSGPAGVSLSGTPALIDAFAGTLASPVQIASLQAGETTSAIVWGKLPANLEGTRGELTVTVTPSGPGGGTPATQTLVAAMVSRGGTAPPGFSPSVRQPQAASSRAPDANRFALIVDLNLYRSPWPGMKSTRPEDAEPVASFFRTALGVPDDHILLLQDELAARDDIEDALAKWLPTRIGSDSVLFIYFGGQAALDGKTGEVSLLPFDATPSSSPVRWVSLRFLQGRLKKLGAHLTVAIVDASVNLASQPHGSKSAPARPSRADWTGDLDNGSVTKGPVLQIVSPRGAGGIPVSLQVLSTNADLDHDGTVTVGEWLRALRGKALVAPTLPPTLAIQSIPLTQVNHQNVP